MGLGVERVKALQKQVQHRLANFAAQARGAPAEMLEGFHTKETKGFHTKETKVTKGI